MYRVIEIELARLGWNKRILSEKTGIVYNTLISKLSGQFDFSFAEAITIKKTLQFKGTLEELFKKEV